MYAFEHILIGNDFEFESNVLDESKLKKKKSTVKLGSPAETMPFSRKISIAYLRWLRGA